MIEIFLDVETKKAFFDTGNHDPGSLGVSFAGICRRNLEEKGKDEFKGFFEEQLNDLWPVLEQADRVVGFNIIGFDFPALRQYYHGDIEAFPILDIMEEVKKDVGHRISLNAIARETLGVEKSGTGLDAISYYEQGKLEELKKYCLLDVRITRDIYDYGKKYGSLKFKNKWNRVVSAKVNFSYKDIKETKVQMSLGV